MFMMSSGHPSSAPSRRSALLPMLLLSLAVLLSLSLSYPPSSSRFEENRSDYLEGTVTMADRLPSWLRARAVDNLPLFTRTNHSAGDLGEVSEALNEVLNYVSRSSSSGGGGNNDGATTEEGSSVIIDVITVGSADSMEYMLAQRNNWASSKHSPRNVVMASEVNTDIPIMKYARCAELSESCGRSFRNDEEDACLQRRMGLAVGASVRRYRKIIRELVVRNGNNNPNNGTRSDDEFAADWERSTLMALPKYLIVTGDRAHYNTERLEECMDRGDGDDTIPIVYAPFTSTIDANLGDEQQQRQQQSNITSFAYPTNGTGVVFNRGALEIWMRRIACFSTGEDDDASYSFSPEPIRYDSETHRVEHKFCGWMEAALATKDTNSSSRHNSFEVAIRNALQISLSASLAAKDKANNANCREEFELSSWYQEMSMSDLLSIYSYTMGSLCKSVSDAMSIPSVEEMLGYFIDQFELSSIDLSETSLCKANFLDKCNLTSSVACADLSLQGLKDMKIEK